MQLINKTQCPDAILRPLLSAAARVAGAESGEVPVTVGQARVCTSYGVANPHREWMKVWLPWNNLAMDALAGAVEFFEVAVHEWKHVADGQYNNSLKRIRAEQPKLPFAQAGSSGRRPRWGTRPEERRAVNLVAHFRREQKIERYADQVLALAMWLEEQRLERRKELGL